MRERPFLIAASFAVIYLVWGSTYLAIRVALESLPPFLLAGTRFVVAGTLLFAVARWRGAEAPSAAQWRGAALTGGLMILGANGLVCWAEQHVPSGAVALVAALAPAWVALLSALGRTGRSGARTWAGVALGVSGVAILAAPGGAGALPPGPVAVLLLSSLCWAGGAVAPGHLELPRSTLAATGAQMACGGSAALLAGTLAGEWGSFHLAGMGGAAVAGWLYLVLAGSVLSLSAYTYLLRATSPAAVSTHSFVNPVVAVTLGWSLGGEPVGPRMLAALPLVVASVALLLSARRAGALPRRRPAAPDQSADMPVVPSRGGARESAGPGRARADARPHGHAPPERHASLPPHLPAAGRRSVPRRRLAVRSKAVPARGGVGGGDAPEGDGGQEGRGAGAPRLRRVLQPL